MLLILVKLFEFVVLPCISLLKKTPHNLYVTNDSINLSISVKTDVKYGQSSVCGGWILNNPSSVLQMFLSFYCPGSCGQQLGPIHLMALPRNLMLTCDISVWLILAFRHWHHHACLWDVSTAGLCLLDWQTCLLLFAYYRSHQGTCFAECCDVMLDPIVVLETSYLQRCFSCFSSDLFQENV